MTKTSTKTKTNTKEVLKMCQKIGTYISKIDTNIRNKRETSKVKPPHTVHTVMTNTNTTTMKKTQEILEMCQKISTYIRIDTNIRNE